MSTNHSLLYSDLKSGYRVEVQTANSTYTFVCKDPKQARFEAQKGGKLEQTLGRLATLAKPIKPGEVKVEAYLDRLMAERGAVFLFDKKQGGASYARFQVKRVRAYDGKGALCYDSRIHIMEKGKKPSDSSDDDFDLSMLAGPDDGDINKDSGLNIRDEEMDDSTIPLGEDDLEVIDDNAGSNVKNGISTTPNSLGTQPAKANPPAPAKGKSIADKMKIA